MTFSISLLFFFFSDGGDSLPHSSNKSKKKGETKKSEEGEPCPPTAKRLFQMSFQAIHTVMGAIVEVGGVFVSGREERKEIESCAFLGMEFFLLELNANCASAPREIFGGLFEMGLRCRIRAGADQGAPRLRMDQVALR